MPPVRVSSLAARHTVSQDSRLLAAVQRQNALALILELSSEGEQWLDAVRLDLETRAGWSKRVDAGVDPPLRRRRCPADQRQP